MPQLTVRGTSGPPVTHRFDQDVITVGRSSENDLVVRDPALSRLHLELRWEACRWVVLDRGSRNGSYLNGRRLTGVQPLAPGDEIGLGATRLVFDSRVEGSVESAPTETDTVPVPFSRRGTGSSAGIEVIGESPAMKRALEAIERIGNSRATVLITGENGTGKELAARLIHHHSSRARRPLVVVNCPALSGSLVEAELFGIERGVATGVEARPGRIEAADGGTLFLDEVGDLDPGVQAKLLRFLQDGSVDRVGGRTTKKVDARILAATNEDLERRVEEGSFRRDLFHRLNVVHIVLPPLRERREDIPLLARAFAARLDRPLSLSPAALEALEAYAFPGNVRELEHMIESAAIFCRGSQIEPGDLPDAVRTASAMSGDESNREDRGQELFRRIVAEGGSFWELVREPYLRRELSREEARDFIRRAWEEGGRSYKGMARLMRTEDQYKKLVNFLQNHDLRVGD